MSLRKRKTYCLLDAEATVEDARASQHFCGAVGGHSHLSFEDLYGQCDGQAGRDDYKAALRKIDKLGRDYLGFDGLLARGEVEWMSFPKVLKPTQALCEILKGMGITLNDLSAKLGSYLAAELASTAVYAHKHHRTAPLKVPGVEAVTVTACVVTDEFSARGEVPVSTAVVAPAVRDPKIPAAERLAVAWPHLMYEQMRCLTSPPEKSAAEKRREKEQLAAYVAETVAKRRQRRMEQTLRENRP